MKAYKMTDEEIERVLRAIPIHKALYKHEKISIEENILFHEESLYLSKFAKLCRYIYKTKLK